MVLPCPVSWVPEVRPSSGEIVKDREAWRAVGHGITELDMTERLNNKYRLRMKKTIKW